MNVDLLVFQEEYLGMSSFLIAIDDADCFNNGWIDLGLWVMICHLNLVVSCYN